MDNKPSSKMVEWFESSGVSESEYDTPGVLGMWHPIVFLS